MIMTGNTTYNVLIAPQDIVYLPRTSEPAPVVVKRPGQVPIRIDKSVIEKGDLISCRFDPAIAKQPGAERLVILKQKQVIGLDGTILVPYVGPVHVIGLKTSELELLLEQQLALFFGFEIQLQVRASRER